MNEISFEDSGTDLAQGEQELIDHLTMGICRILEAHPLIKDVKVEVSPAATVSMLTSWERLNGIFLPMDIKNFFRSTNGIQLRWGLVHADELLKIGNFSINKIEEIVPIDSKLHLDITDPGQNSSKQNSLSSSNASSNLATVDLTEIQRISSNTGYEHIFKKPFKAFKIDSSSPETGYICMLVPNNTQFLESEERSTGEDDGQGLHRNDRDVQIYFLDRAFQWYFLASSFTMFYRMGLHHLGLPDWTHRFTEYGLSPWTEQIFWLVAPNLLRPVVPRDHQSKSCPEIWSKSVPSDVAEPNPHINILNMSQFKKKQKIKNKDLRLMNPNSSITDESK